MTLWPAAKIVNGRARHPQSQGSVERSNQDVELMLGAMMKDLGTSDWPMCLPFIAHQKNNRFHKGIDAIPYEVQYGSKCKIGLADCLLPTWFFNEDVMNEEDLERVLQISESSNNVSESLNIVSESLNNVSESSNNVSVSFNNVSESSNNVSVSSNNVSVSFNNVSESLSNVSVSSNNVSETLNNVSESLNNVSESSNNVSVSLNNVSESLNDVSESLNDVSESLNNTTCCCGCGT